LSAVSFLAAQVKPSNRTNAQSELSRAADKVHQEGLDAKLPPHLATLLGLSQETECPVKQAVIRNGTVVQGFDIPLVPRGNIVIFVADDGSNDQTLYLTSNDGRLRKIVAVRNGIGRVSKITDNDKQAFENEKQFWLSHLTPLPHK
jgi:hypothetical protein